MGLRPTGRRPDGAGRRRAGHGHRRRRGARRGATSAAGAAGDRGVAAQRGGGPAHARRGRRDGGGTSPRTTLPVPGRLAWTWWSAGTRCAPTGREIARVLRPGGTFLSQQIGAGTMRELRRRCSARCRRRHRRQLPEQAAAAPRAAGLRVRDLREATLRAVFSRHRRGGLVPAQGDLDGARVHRGPVPAAAPGPARAHHRRGRLRRPRPTLPHRGDPALTLTPRSCDVAAPAQKWRTARRPPQVHDRPGRRRVRRARALGAD